MGAEFFDSVRGFQCHMESCLSGGSEFDRCTLRYVASGVQSRFLLKEFSQTHSGVHVHELDKFARNAGHTVCRIMRSSDSGGIMSARNRGTD